MNSIPNDEFVTISELRQWEYCPRVVWHGRILGRGRPTTFKMQQGLEDEILKQRLESRRTFHAYSMHARRRTFKTFLRSERLRLSGVVDMILELGQSSIEHGRCESTTQQFIPVEFKSADSANPPTHHLVQLAAYALAIEDLTGTPVEFGFLVALPSGRVRRVEFNQALRSKVEKTRLAVLDALSKGVIPPPTPHRGKCVDCEFKRFCNDVW